ncbi:MAG: hypothetical protein ABJJ05_06785 [Maribacter litoralis]|uniref:hypothetical protein n=1 Tax=Maribacter litoralis TaxID=2059726 RepID=UPI003296F2F1
MKDVNYFERLWLLVLAPTIACMVAFEAIPEIRVQNLLGIQFSRNFSELEQLINEHYLQTLSNNNYFDFIFIISYTGLFIVSLLLIVKALNFKVKKRWFLFCLVPGILDCIENFLFMSLLRGETSYFNFYYWVVRIKWGLLIPYVQILLAIFLFYILYHSYRFGYYLKAKFD